MELLGQFFIRVGLDAQSLADGENFEEEGQLSTITFGDLNRHQRLVVLNKVEEGALSLEVLGWQGGMSAHP